MYKMFLIGLRFLVGISHFHAIRVAREKARQRSMLRGLKPQAIMTLPVLSF